MTYLSAPPEGGHHVTEMLVIDTMSTSTPCGGPDGPIEKCIFMARLAYACCINLVL